MKPQLFRSYAEWEACARSLGCRGPYELTGNPPGQQFVYPQGGTAAIWNRQASRGTVFEPDTEPK